MIDSKNPSTRKRERSPPAVEEDEDDIGPSMPTAAAEDSDDEIGPMPTAEGADVVVSNGRKKKRAGKLSANYGSGFRANGESSAS
jgi:hypothetical protein